MTTELIKLLSGALIGIGLSLMAICFAVLAAERWKK
jgi:hypothetical protein